MNLSGTAFQRNVEANLAVKGKDSSLFRESGDWFEMHWIGKAGNQVLAVTQSVLAHMEKHFTSRGVDETHVSEGQVDILWKDCVALSYCPDPSVHFDDSSIQYGPAATSYTRSLAKCLATKWMEMGCPAPRQDGKNKGLVFRVRPGGPKATTLFLGQGTTQGDHLHLSFLGTFVNRFPGEIEQWKDRILRFGKRLPEYDIHITEKEKGISIRFPRINQPDDELLIELENILREFLSMVR